VKQYNLKNDDTLPATIGLSPILLWSSIGFFKQTVGSLFSTASPDDRHLAFSNKSADSSAVQLNGHFLAHSDMKRIPGGDKHFSRFERNLSSYG
jgi:hypothetical protein